MNIWLINPFSDLPHEGASEGRFCCLARVLAEQGHTVTWWSMDFHHRKKSRRSLDGRWEMGDGRWDGLEIVLLPVPRYTKNISFARLRSHRAYGQAFEQAAAERIAREPDAVPDVIHLSTPPLDCVAPVLDLKERFGCRVTVDVMDLWPETFYRTVPRGLSSLGKLLFAPLHRKARRAYREADGVSAVSQEYLDLVAGVRPSTSSGSLREEQEARSRKQNSALKPQASSLRSQASGLRSQTPDLHLCYVGGELLESKADPPQVSLLRRGYGGQTGLRSQFSKATFIYVGAMTPTYDLETILEAAAHLKGQGLEFEVVFAGSGISEAALKAKANALGLQDAVTFLGFLNQDALKEALRQADVGLNAIMPGTFITMPHKLSDYLCAGLAVINSTEGEADDLLRKHGAGVFYHAGEMASLAGAMKGFIEEPEKLAAHKQSAYRLAATQFDRSHTYPAMAEWITA